MTHAYDRNNVSGVYFLQAQVSGLVKIGFSRNIPERIKSLATASPEPLLLIGTIAGPVELEGSLHRGLKEHRVNGEWFRPTEAILALAKAGSAVSPVMHGPMASLPAGVRRLVELRHWPGCDLGEEQTLQDLNRLAFDHDLNGSSNVCNLCGFAIGDFCRHGVWCHGPGCLLAVAVASASREEVEAALGHDSGCEECEESERYKQWLSAQDFKFGGDVFVEGD